MGSPSSRASVNVLLVAASGPCTEVVREVVRAMPSVRLFEASEASEVRARLGQRDMDVLLVDPEQIEEGRHGLAGLLGVSPRTTWIAMSYGLSLRGYQEALRLGAVDVLSRPLQAAELERALRLAIDSRETFRGSIHGLSLADLLQAFQLAQRSVGIEVRGDGVRGLVMLREGELVHAETVQGQGEGALGQMLALSTGSLTTVPFRPTATTVWRSLHEVLLDSLRLFDEQGRQPPPRRSEFPAAPLPEQPLSPECASARELIVGLDAALGASLLWPREEVLVAGCLGPSQWTEVRALSGEILARSSEGWRWLEWTLAGFGLVLLRGVAGGPVLLLAQPFRERFDDRRFRWNTARVRRFIEQPGGGWWKTPI